MLRVLIVEDEALIVMDLEHLIEKAGHLVVADAASVRSLKQLDHALCPDLALVDLQLAHGSSGLDAADHIRLVWPGAFIAFVTANPRMVLPDIEKGDAVVPKPFTSSGLMKALAFIEDGLSNPPPSVGAPDNFIPNPKLQVRWQMA